MKEAEARKAIEELKKQGRVFSNLYADGMLARSEEVFKNERAVISICDDHGVKRLYYFYNYADSLFKLLSSGCTPSDSNIVLEFMTRNEDENRDFFEVAGFTQIAGLKRMSVRDCESALKENRMDEYFDETVGCFPDIETAGEINKVLWNIFDTRISHLQDDSEIEESIRNGEFTIHRSNEGVVDAILQAQIQPRKFYINQVYNGTDKHIIHAMLQNRLKEYFVQGGKYVFAWIDRDNIASLKFHEKYGLQHDGMWNMVYARGKNNK